MQQSTKKFKHISKKWIISSVAVVLIVAVGVGSIMIYKNRSSSASAVQQRLVPVTKGNIEVSLSGSGTVQSASTSDLMSNVEGKITNAYFKEGDTIKKGDLLFEIDDTNAKLNIQKIQNQISQAQLSVNSTQKTFSNMVVTAPISGKVTGVTAKVGDSVNNGMTLFTITDTQHFQLEVPININDIPSIKAGQKVEVQVQELMDTVSGVVSGIDDNTYTASNGGIVRNVIVSVTNPGRLTEGMTASAEISTSNGVKSSCENAAFEYVNKQTVKAYANGTIGKLNVKENQFINKGQTLVELSNDDLQVTQQTNDLKVEDLQNQLTAAQKQLADYMVYSTIDGTLTTLSAKEGDSVKAGTALASIRNFNQMQFTISVDELDISKVKVGQKATITIDALTDTTKNPLTGEVVKKAMEGTSTNGVATYDVTINIDKTDNLLAGMNANAKIIINSKDDVLRVPLEAITKLGDKSFVRVKGSGGNSQTSGFQGGNMRQNSSGQNTTGNSANRQNRTWGTGSSNGSSSPNRSSRYGNSSSSSSASGNKFKNISSANQQYYANTIMKPVELGINNDEYVEIISGLTENEVVVLPQLVTSSSSTTNNQAGFNLGGMGALGGMGGMQGPDRRQFNNSGNSSNKSSNSSQRQNQGGN